MSRMIKKSMDYLVCSKCGIDNVKNESFTRCEDGCKPVVTGDMTKTIVITEKHEIQKANE